MTRAMILASGFALIGLVGCGPVATDSSKVGDMTAKMSEKMAEQGEKMKETMAAEFKKVKEGFDGEVKAIGEKIEEMGKGMKDPKDKDGKPLGAEALKTLSDKFTSANTAFTELKEKLKGFDMEKLKDNLSLTKLKDEILPLIAKLKQLVGLDK